MLALAASFLCSFLRCLFSFSLVSLVSPHSGQVHVLFASPCVVMCGCSPRVVDVLVLRVVCLVEESFYFFYGCFTFFVVFFDGVLHFVDL